MVWRTLLLVSLLMSLLHSAASANSETTPFWNDGGVYFMLDFSAGKPNDPVAAEAYEADLGFETGFRAGMGYAFGPMRLEGQFGYENFKLNNVNPVSGSPLTETDSAGDLSGYTVLANIYYDFGVIDGVRPFIGAGAGVTHLKADFHGFSCTLLPLGCHDGEQIVGGSDNVMAWQAMAGAAKPTRSGRGEWFLGYRYFGTDDLSLNLTGYGVVTQEGVQSHSVMIGWRWYLGPLAEPGTR